jgi:hypothetical protein
MKVTERLKERRRRKARKRHLDERERQRKLNQQDTQDAIQNAAEGWGVGGQGTSAGN